MWHTAVGVYTTISDSCATFRWRSAGSGFKTEENSSAAALWAGTGVGASLAQLKEGQSLNNYTEQMTTEVTKSTIRTTSTFSHADIYIAFVYISYFSEQLPATRNCFWSKQHCRKALSEATVHRTPITMHKFTWEKEGTLIVQVCMANHHNVPTRNIQCSWLIVQYDKEKPAHAGCSNSDSHATEKA